MLHKIEFLEQSASEKNLQLLSKFKNLRQRAAEERAEGFNVLFMLFKVFDPDRILTRTLQYVRWLWRPPVVAVAKDARSKTSTDIYFIEVQPFERNYTQSQQAGGDGGGGGGGEDDQNQISKRQKEIIAATWNQLKGAGAKGTDAENAAFLASVQ